MKIACIGECMIELTLPRGDGGGSRVDFAGDSFNTAVYLKRAAPEVGVAYVTAIGTDTLSDRMLAAFEAEGLDTTLVERRTDRVPGLYAISLDATGERSFTYWRDTSAARTLFLPPAEVTPQSLEDQDILYLSGITLAVLQPEARASLKDFLRDWRAAGGRLAFDSNYRPRLWPDRGTAEAEITGFWKITDIGLPSLDDEMALYGDPGPSEVLTRLRDAGVAEGALKRGPAGPLAIGWNGELPEFPPAEKVVDTTAAGDSFNGGYLAALARGLGPAERLATGHALASLVVGFPGAIIPAKAIR